jgi:ribosomal protein L11 methyltransferase
MGWLSIRLRSAAPRVAALCDLLDAAGAVAVTLGSGSSGEVLEPAPGEMPLWPVADVDALFDLDLDVAALSERLAAAALHDADVPLEVRFVEDADWSRTWRDFAQAYCFGQRLWVVPRDASPPDPGGVVLRLDPGLAFGTGSHPTTALCLEWLATRMPSGIDVVDYGAGSGILGIAAILLGAHRVVAIDHDRQARLATRNNATYNGVPTAQLEVMDVAAPVPGHYDLVLANILAGPLIALAPRLAALLKPGGTLVLSGVLECQLDEVLASYPDLEFGEPCLREAWVMVEGTKTSG